MLATPQLMHMQFLTTWASLLRLSPNIENIVKAKICSMPDTVFEVQRDTADKILIGYLISNDFGLGVLPNKLTVTIWCLCINGAFLCLRILEIRFSLYTSNELCSYLCRKRWNIFTNNYHHCCSNSCLCGDLLYFMLLLHKQESKAEIQYYRRGKW